MINTCKCEFCGASFINEQRVKAHTDQCSYNPKFKTCFSCSLLLKVQSDNVIRCTKKGKQHVARMRCQTWQPKK